MAREVKPLVVTSTDEKQSSCSNELNANTSMLVSPSVAGDESFVYDHIYKGIKGLLSRRPSFNGYKEKSTELGGPLTYCLSGCLRNNATSSRATSEDDGGDAGCNTSMRDLQLKLIKVTRRKQVKYTFEIDDCKISWNNGKKEINLDAIKDIRYGDMAANYMDVYSIHGERRNLWLTVIYSVNKNKLKALHILAENKEDFQLFIETVLYLANSRRKLMEDMAVPNNEQFADIHWQASVSTKKEDQSKDTLSFSDVKRLCNRYHVSCSDSYLFDLFKKADTNKNGLLNFTEFQNFVKYLKDRPEINSIWTQLKNDAGKVTFDKFYQFLTSVQGETIPKTNALKIFMKYSLNNDYLEITGFSKFLSNQTFLKFLEEDYSKPLNQYFISSSHNTYLMGKQVADEVSIEAYIQTLQQGCRCIEIDIWDGDHGPMVCHGVFTQSIPLEDVVKTIRKYAFITSPYPLIVSLEIHCKKENQLLITKIMKEILGEAIFVISPNSPLLSPMDLKNKIILKSKKTHSFKSDIISSSASSCTSSSSSSLDSLTEFADPIAIKKRGNNGVNALNISKKVMISEKILEISGIHGVTFRNFSLPESKTTTHCFSLSERKFNNLYKDESQRLAINKHNRRHLMRVYPHMLRYKSSNFNPLKFWKEGVQMVATNWQTYDIGQQLNHAMFHVSLDRNSIWHSGYVLKPDYLLTNIHKTRDIPLLNEILKRNKVRVTIDLISGQMLPLQNSKIIAPHVEMEFVTDDVVQDVRVDNCTEIIVYNSSNFISTRVVKDNGFNPVWNASCQCVLTNTKLNFVRFTVKTSAQVIATCCIRLNYLKQGYRHIPLYSVNGEKYIFSTLFIHYKQSEYCI